MTNKNFLSPIAKVSDPGKEWLDPDKALEKNLDPDARRFFKPRIKSKFFIQPESESDRNIQTLIRNSDHNNPGTL